MSCLSPTRPPKVTPKRPPEAVLAAGSSEGEGRKVPKLKIAARSQQRLSVVGSVSEFDV